MAHPLVPILGGTFDPVHNGHLRCALEIAEWTGEPVHLLPSARPAHRDSPGASAAERWELLRLATADFPRLIPDDRELKREGETYTVDTLAALREEAPDAAHAFIVGADAFAGLPRWRQWRRLLTLAHFIVVPRPGHALEVPAELAGWYAANRVDGPDGLRASVAGRVVEADVTPLEVSATQIRGILAAGRDPAFLVPEPVRAWLRAHPVYRTDRPAAGDTDAVGV